MYSSLENERERVESVQSLELLDTPPQQRFDRITKLCAEILGADAALITLVDEDRQWILSALGTDLKEIPREISFCSHAVAADGMLEIPDATKDERFADNPLVTGSMKVRSYFGQPIRAADGFMLGTICILAKKPRKISARERSQLEALAATVEDLIQAHVESRITASLNKLLWQETRDLKKSNRLLKQAQHLGKIGSWELDLQSREFSFSDEMYAIAAAGKGTCLNGDRVLSFYDPADRPRIRNAIKKAISDGLPFHYEGDFHAEDGSVKRVRCSGERFDGGEQHGSRVVGVVQDVSAVYHTNLALKRAAEYDSLTGIFNRHAFDRSLNEQIRQHRSTGEALSLILLDLDGFKDINDSFGHVVGDVVLEEISSRIMRAIPQDAVIARWGGDEFALLPPLGTSVSTAIDVAERLLETIAHQVEISGQKLQLSGTCGIAQFQSGMGAKELVRRADLALYHGKKRERSAVHCYSSDLENCNIARQSAIAEVRAALDEERLFAGYQPVVDLQTCGIIGMEALMRLNSRAGGRLTATKVLPALLDPLLSREITDRMLRTVCCDLATLEAAHPELQFVSLNVTEADLLSRGFAPRFLESLNDVGMSPRHVALEITETMLLVNDTSTVRRVLSELSEHGVRIALDDFGTGFSSLSHLRDFPIDKVKIDCSFVQAMVADCQARAIVQALISMARNMQIEIIAEGIETEEQLNLLREMGCRLGQGFYFSPALDLGRATIARFSNRAVPSEKRRIAA